MKTNLLFVLVFFFQPAFCFGQTKPLTIAEYIRYKNSIVPLNGAVLVSQANRILIEDYFGYSDYATKTAIDTSSVFEIASSTKPITATAVLMLQDQKKLSLDEKIAKYLPGIPTAWAGITVKQLLSHTSGIEEISRLLPTDKLSMSSAALYGLFKNKALVFAPGTKFSYSNTNYIVLSYLIEKITGEKFEAFISKTIFQPLGMQHSGFSYVDHRKTATGYDNALLMNEVPAAQKVNAELLKGAGGMYSTAQDLLRFLRGFKTLLAPQTFQLMLTPVKEDYGLGWHVDHQFGKTVLKHPGGFRGTATELRYSVEESTAVIILSNVSHNDITNRYVAFDIMRILHGEAISKPNIADLTGQYKFPDEWAKKFGSCCFHINAEDDRLTLEIPSTPKTIRYLYPMDSTRFFFYGESGVLVGFDKQSLVIKSPSLGNIACAKMPN